jgi:hypothetical protein
MVKETEEEIKKRIEFRNAYYDFYKWLNYMERELQKMAKGMDSKDQKYISEINKKIKDIYKIYYKLHEIYLYKLHK